MGFDFRQFNMTILVTLLILSVFQFFPNPVYGLEVVDQKQETFLSFSPTLYVGNLSGQVIKPALSPYVAIEVLIGPTHETNTFTLKLREGCPGPSLGTILTEVTVTDPANPLGVGHWVRFNFPAAVAVTIGSTYWIQLNNTGTNTGVQWFGAMEDPYLTGQNPYWAILQRVDTNQIMASYHEDFAFRTYVEVSDPILSVEYNDSPVSSIEMPVCNEFTINVTIENIPSPLGMTGFDLGISWDPSLMELKELVEVGEAEARPSWDSHASIYDNRVECHGEGSAWYEDSVWASLTFHCLGQGSSKITVYSLADSIDLTDGGVTYHSSPDPYEIICNQLSSNAVGGFFVPLNKFNILLPYIALVGLIGAISTIFAIRRWRKD